MTDNQIKQTIHNLPHAFDSEYWNLANTTYKEEVFLSIVLSLKIPKEKALKLQSKIFPKNILLRQILKEEVVLWQWFGILLIILAIVIMNINFSKKKI